MVKLRFGHAPGHVRASAGGTKALSDRCSNSAVAGRPAVKAPLKHAEDHIVIAIDEPPHLRLLEIVEGGDVGMPAVAGIPR